MSLSLFKSAALVSTMTFVSRILGFVRDMLAAQIFGVNAQVDAFLIAFKLPNFLRALFAEGSFSQAFVPTLSHYKNQKSPAQIRVFISHTAGCLSLILLLVTLLGIIFMPLLVKLSAPGLDHHRFTLAVYLCRITFPYLLLISLTAFIGAVLNCYGKFAIPAITPALLNISLILAALFARHWFKMSIESQAWGILLAGIMQLSFQLPYLKKLGFLSLPKINFYNEGVKKILKLMLPAIFGASIVQIGILINTVFASFLQTGSIAWLYYAERLAYFPQGVFGVALATVTLPHLSRQFAQNSAQGFTAALDFGIRCNLFIGLPAALTMGVLSGPLVATLFYYGHFQAKDVFMTQQSVIAYAAGLQAFMLVKLLSTGFYARADIKTPVRIGIAAVLFNIILNIALIYPLRHAGLAWATSLASCFNVGLLGYFLYQKNIFRFQSGWKAFLIRLLLANGLMLIWQIFAQGHVELWLSWTGQTRIIRLVYLLFMSLLIYFMSLWLSGFRPKHFTLTPDTPI